MIIEVKKYSLFVKQGELNRWCREHKLAVVYRKRWVLLRDEYSEEEGYASAVCERCTRLIGVAVLLKMELETVEKAVIAYCGKRNRALALRCGDGLLVHPTSVANAVASLIVPQMRKLEKE